MPAEEAIAKMELPPGFKATVFAAEPDVQNPIAMTFDGRGRLWIAENYTYAESPKRFDYRLRDRILIFEDRNGNGHFSSRKVFTDNLQTLTSIEVGHGGVWALCPPNLLFIPDRNGDDTPDGTPEVVLDGFTVPQENYHNLASGLRFGPDGWLYGRVGHSAPGEIGAPGTPPEKRIPVRGGMWRYHPVRKVFEAITSGTTNPWGHDWNEYGELFHVNTVNGHLWHVFPGAHFLSGTSLDPNPHVYSLIEMHADHWHFDTGKSWTDSRNGAADAFGGGHSHIGAMIYLGDNWPEEYRSHLFTWNQHGRRANQEILERSGSGYVAHHGQDIFKAADPWFTGLDLRYGPDGAVYAIDWSNSGECHGRDGIDRTSGRIYKFTYGGGNDVEFGNLAKMSTDSLVNLHTRPNEWFSRQARIELATRAATGENLGDAKKQLRDLFDNDKQVTVKLRAAWTLFAIDGADDAFFQQILLHADEHIRAWAVRFITDSWPLDTVVSQRPEWWPDRAASDQASLLWQAQFVLRARDDTSGLVRLAIASALQRMPPAQRPAIAAGLLSHAEDASDHNLPRLIWYGLIPVADSNPAQLVRLASFCKIPLTRKFISRRITEDIEKDPALLDALLKVTLENASPDFAADILAGMAEALAGWRKAPKPANWDALVEKFGTDSTLADRVRDLSVLFGDGRALDEVKQVALNKDADLTQRQGALQTLIDNKAPDLREICEKLLSVPFLNPVAARGLSTFDDPAVGETLVKAYRQFHQTERPQLLAMLMSRPAFIRPLLTAIGAGKIAKRDLTPLHAHQIRAFNDPELNKQLTEVWGEMHESGTGKVEFATKLKEQLTPQTLASADKSAGRAVFARTCAICHRLYGEGADVGPDLTGSGRANLDYLIDNIVDPSAVVSADYRLNVATLKDGRVLNGFVTSKSDTTLTFKTVAETQSIARADIQSLQELSTSLMPEGLLEALPAEDLRNLIAYLMNPVQVSLPAANTQ